jgi:hypothetical protein
MTEGFDRRIGSIVGTLLQKQDLLLNKISINAKGNFSEISFNK